MISCFSKLFAHTLMPYGFVAKRELFGNFLPDFVKVFACAQRLDSGQIKKVFAVVAVEVEDYGPVDTALFSGHKLEIDVGKDGICFELYVFDVLHSWLILRTVADLSWLLLEQLVRFI